MRVPLVLRCPMASRDDDRHFIQFARHGRMESHLRAKLLDEIAYLRTAQQHIEGTTGPPPLAVDEMFHRGFLWRRHLVPLERLEPVADKLHVAWVGSWSLRHQQRCSCGNHENDNNHDMLHRFSKGMRDCPLVRLLLEVHLSRNLNNSGTAGQAGCSHSSEGTETIADRRTRIDELTRGRVELSRRVHSGPIRMVERIVSFQSKLDVLLWVFSVFELFEERDIPIVQTRPTHIVQP